MTHHFSTHPASCRPAFRRLPCVTGLLALMCLVSSALAEPNQADRFIDQGDQWMEKGELDKASADYSEALRLNPQSARAFNNRGFAWHQKGMFDKAVADFSEALVIQPGYLQALNNRGTSYTALRKYDHAIADFSKALKINPLELAALQGRAFVYQAKGAPELAIDDLTASIEIVKTSRNVYLLVKMHLDRGQAWRTCGQHDKALADAETALRVNPKSGWTYGLRSQFWQDAGDHVRAVADLEEALRIDPKYTWAYCERARVRFKMSEVAKATQDWEKAVAIYEASLATAPKYDLNNFAWILATCPVERLRDGAKAVGLAKRACELTGWKDCYSLTSLAAAYAETGAFDKAVELQAKALAVLTLTADRVKFEKELEFYRKGRPYRDPDMSTTVPATLRK